jgi:hypothetical protein
MSLSQFYTWRALQLRALGVEERNERDMSGLLGTLKPTFLL